MTATIIRPALLDDFLYIDSLRKREGNALGFIPKAAYLSTITKLPIGNRRRWQYSRLMVTEDNGDLTGFCFSTYSDSKARIIQIAVQEDARRWHRASLLEQDVRDQALNRGKSSIFCRVAYDLESNFFWQAMGYKPLRTVESTWLNQRKSKSKRPLIVYFAHLPLPLFD